MLNFFAPALGVGVLASALTKLFWWRGLRTTPWLVLFGAASAAGAVVLVLGLLITGRDGRMSTYVAMVVAVGLALWAVGFGKARR